MEEEILFRCRLGIALRHRSDIQHRLFDYYGSAKTIFSFGAADLCRHTGITPYLAEIILDKKLEAAAQCEMEWAASKNIRVLSPGYASYPALLSECPDYPLILYVVGKGKADPPKIISVVGTRNASNYGLEQCSSLIHALARRGHCFTVVSGLAFGIDACAHRSALEAGQETIAVLPNGLDHIYPASNAPLARDIVAQGLCLTEFPKSTDSIRSNFLQRNRIIAALSRATMVVESKENGGSLITAHLALDYHRDVLAVPGRLTDIRSKGCNALISSNKAAMVTDVECLESLLGWTPPQVSGSLFPVMDKDLQPVWEEIRKNSADINVLFQKIGLTLPDLSARLTKLEIAGLVKCLPDGRYVCT